MTNKNDEFLKRLLATFRGEADEHLQAMSAGLIELEKNPAADRYAEIIETVFREVHSLKGAARAVSLKEIESICHPLESVFSALKNKLLTMSQPLLDLIYQAIDTIGGLLVPDAGMPASHKVTHGQLIRQLDDALQGRIAESEVVPSESPPQWVSAGPVPEQPPVETNEPVTRIVPTSAPTITSETVRVSTQKLDAVMRQVEELLTPRLASAQRANELREVAVSFAIWKKQRARVRPVLRQIERYVEGSSGGLPKCATSEFQTKTLPKLLAHLESEQLFMKTLEERLLRLSRFAAHDRRALAGMNDSLLHDVKEMQLLPFSSLLVIYPRFIRELAREQGKQVELVIQGSEIEIDRHTLEEMKDPLMHLLRNSIDHGIEQPAIRQDKGKSPHGTITIAIVQKDGGKIEIMVADDGAGIDTVRVKEVSSKLGLISAEEAEKLDEQEAQTLVFQSGISTSQIITDQ